MMGSSKKIQQKNKLVTVSIVSLFLIISFISSTPIDAAEADYTCDPMIYYGVQHCVSQDGNVHFIKIDLDDEHVSFQTVLPGGNNWECNSVNPVSKDPTSNCTDPYPFESVAHMLGRKVDEGAIAAINTDYFGADGDHGAQGLAVKNGIRLDGPAHGVYNDISINYPSLAISNSNSITIGVAGSHDHINSNLDSIYYNTVAGAPVIIDNYQIIGNHACIAGVYPYLTCDDENQSAVGITDEGEMILITGKRDADGIANFLQSNFNVKTSLKFDGGTSSSIAWLSETGEVLDFHPKVSNSPPVAEGLLVFSEKITNTATVTDIPDPDSYSCSQPGYVDFEGFPDETELENLTIAGLQFTTTGGYTWVVAGCETGKYNCKYPYGAYMSHGMHEAWLGPYQGAGRIDFDAGQASYFSLLVSNNTPVWLDAYDENGNIIATAGPASSNINTGHMTELRITRASRDIDYVYVHDQGNYFVIDDVCTNAPGTPNTINRVVDQTFFMQTGQSVFGNFILNLISGFRRYLRIFIGPFFSDVDLILTRPDGSIVSPDDPGVTINKTANFIEVTIDNAESGEWSYEIIANELEPGGENIRITIDEQLIAIENQPPTADANGPYETDEGIPITLDASGSSDPDDNISLYEWDMDNDGEYDDATGVTTEMVWWEDGMYLVGLRVTDDGGLSDTDETTVTVSNVPPEVTNNLPSQSVQYSDYITEVTITSTDVLADPMTYSVSGIPDYLSLTELGCVEDGNYLVCTWTLSGQIGVAASMNTINLTATDDEGDSGETEFTIEVLPEDADLGFAESNSIAVEVAEPGGNSPAFSLLVKARETVPDIPEGMSAPGDISLAEVLVTLAPVGPGTPVIGTCFPVTVAGSGYDAVLITQCDFDDVPVNTYTVEASAGGGFYTGYNEDVLVVFDPSLGFTTGGGWFYWPGTDEKTNFGYTMKYNKKGTRVQGNFLMIRHMPDGTIYRVKSNALYGLALGSDDEFGWASFSGKSTYLEPGWPEPIGNHEFVVYVEDHGQSGDQVWIEIHDRRGNIIAVMSFDREATENTVPLEGGNLVVPH